MKKIYECKLILLGDSGVGKTTLLNKILYGNINIKNTLSTIGVSFDIKLYEKIDKTIKLKVWDTAGQERFYAITKNYYRNVDIALFFFSIDNIESFNNLTKWINGFNKSCPYSIMYIIGNKSDLVKNRKITFDKAFSFAKDNNAIYLETSYNDKRSHNNLLDNILDKYIEKINQESDLLKTPPESERHSFIFRNKKSNCCY
jgi:small GTP-binding protein